MPSLDIFNNDAFSVTQLTNAINEVPSIPSRLAQLGLFTEDGIITPQFGIEFEGASLKLVSNAVRGAPGSSRKRDKRKMIPFMTTHLPQDGYVGADEIAGVRAFGSETELQTVQTVVNKELARMRRDLDVTIEYQRIGAIRGQILDSDGTTVLLDLYTTFGVTKQFHVLALNTAGTNVRNKLVEAKRKVELALDGIPYKSLRAICSASFFDKLTGHEKVEATYNLYNNSEILRSDNRKGFTYADITFEEYSGAVAGIPFVEDGKAYLIAEGVPDLFITKFAPADYLETVNTTGLPYYAKQEITRMGKGVDIESQSNPISINTRPQAMIELRIS